MFLQNPLCFPESVDTALSPYRRLQLLCQALPGISLSDSARRANSRAEEKSANFNCFRPSSVKSLHPNDNELDALDARFEQDAISDSTDVSSSIGLSKSNSFNSNMSQSLIYDGYFLHLSNVAKRSYCGLYDCQLHISLDWEESDIESEVEWPDLSRFSKVRSNSSFTQDSVSSSLFSPTLSACDCVSSCGSSSSTLYPSSPENEVYSRCHLRRPSFPSLTAPWIYGTERQQALDLISPFIKPVAKKASQDVPNYNAPAPNALHPAKTGYALWVGNLGPKTTLDDLRELFGSSKLQSIYLIQRTGCAFVNYADEAGLHEAMSLFERRGKKLYDHDLVIKAQIGDDGDKNQASSTKSATASAPATFTEPDNNVTSAEGSETRYFICKSLTVDDLEFAKKQGKWSTQLRNKDRLNEAFRTSKATYLVFSANRTSAFYGFARLDAEFTENPGSDDDRASASDGKINVTDVSEPDIIPTAEAYHPDDGVLIPAGVTVIDQLRGSQFWKVSGCACVEPEVNKWTAPAKITWLSPSESIVPFCHTRQMKNALNANKPVKVARDGTEIDPAIGAQLCALFSA